MENDLMLNIVAENSVFHKKSKKRLGPKLGKNRKQRIAARRKLKKKIQKFQNDDKQNHLDLIEKNSIGDISSVKDGSPLKLERTKNQEKGAYFNKNKPRFRKPKFSLFAGNPSIPAVEFSKTDSIKTDSEVATCDSFAGLNVFSGLKEYIIEKMQLETMTAIQSKAIPVLLSSRDVLIKSETGSGKTLAYALPMIERLQALDPPITRTDGPVAIILVPTRELALQTFQLFQRLTLPVRRIVATCIIGGQKRKSEKACLRKGCNILISTPGRFKDHIENTSCLSLKNVKWLVFDEADRLLDMGFQKDINLILSTLRTNSEEKQQIVLLSATLTKGVENLVKLALNDPVRIEVKPISKTLIKPNFVDPLTGLSIDLVPLPDQLTQYITILPRKMRLIILLAFVKLHCFSGKNSKILVFLSCRDSVIFHLALLKYFAKKEAAETSNDIDSLSLHGGMSQQERIAAVKQFKLAKCGVLLCTDVAARGLDIPNVDWVVQYTSPGNPVDYIHRVGRTARAGHQGNALLFLAPAEADYVKLLQSFNINAKELKVDELICGILDSVNKNVQYNVRLQMAKEKASELHEELEKHVQQNRGLKQMAVKAFTAFVRAYATYPSSLKKIFHVKGLHLGHVAKSFALQDAPSDAQKIVQTNKRPEVKKFSGQSKRAKEIKENVGSNVENVANTTENIDLVHKVATKKKKIEKHPFLSKFDLMSEFSSGLESSAGPVKRRKLK